MMLAASTSVAASTCKPINYQEGEVLTVNSFMGLGTRIGLPSPLASFPRLTNGQNWDVMAEVGDKHIIVVPLNNKKGGENTMLFAFTEDGNAFDIRIDRVLTSKMNNACVVIKEHKKPTYQKTHLIANKPKPPQRVKPPKSPNADLIEVYEKTGAQPVETVPGKKKLVAGYGHSKYRKVETGEFKENMERLVKKNGYKHVKWDPRVANCMWKQDTSYDIPDSKKTAEDIIAFYAKTQDFFPRFSSIDKHVHLSYHGNPSNLTKCGKE